MSTILSQGTEPIISTKSPPSLEFDSKSSRSSQLSPAAGILQSVSSPQTTARLEEEGLILDNDEAIETRRDNNESVRQAELEGGRKRF